MTNSVEPRSETATSFFLSYSRKDRTFMYRLAAALEARGYRPVFDNSEHMHEDPDLRLTAQDEWWTSLKTMIASSDVMVFLVSPDSAASLVCDDEIAHAKSLGKRVIAILRRDIDFNTAPERLRSLNVRLDFRGDEEAKFNQALDALCAELETDIGWHRLGARLMRQAEHWDQSERPEGQLLRSDAIADAEAWVGRRPANAPSPGIVVLEFLEASRNLENKNRKNLLTQIARSFVLPVRQAVENKNFIAALKYLTAAAVLTEDPSFTLEPKLKKAGSRAIGDCAVRGFISVGAKKISDVDILPKSGKVLTSEANGRIILWDIATSSAIYEIKEDHSYEDHEGRSFEGNTGVMFSKDERSFFSFAIDYTDHFPIKKWDISSGEAQNISEVETHSVLNSEKRISRRRGFTGRQVLGRSLEIVTSNNAVMIVEDSEPEFDEENKGSGFSVTRQYSKSGRYELWLPDVEDQEKPYHERQNWNAALLVDAKTKALISTFTHNSEEVISAALSKNESQLCTMDMAGCIKLWDVSEQLEMKRIHREGETGRLDFSLDGKKLTLTNGEGTYSWNIEKITHYNSFAERLLFVVSTGLWSYGDDNVDFLTRTAPDNSIELLASMIKDGEKIRKHAQSALGSSFVEPQMVTSPGK